MDDCDLGGAFSLEANLAVVKRAANGDEAQNDERQHEVEEDDDLAARSARAARRRPDGCLGAQGLTRRLQDDAFAALFPSPKLVIGAHINIPFAAPVRGEAFSPFGGKSAL
jgi:hypothetical protein